MKHIPETENALVLRTDFSDEPTWDALRVAIRESDGQFRASVDFVSDRDFDGTSTQQVLTLLRKDTNHTFMFIVDQETVARDDRPVLVIDLFVEPGRTFRVIPSAMWSGENSLSLANMDFAEFAESADEDGIFRGFPEA